ncbi:hypothetical protein C2855_14755 [Aeromonas bestiarum]|nr:hypothetical protein C2855_14755 [Aeromonas bestiarum]
MPIPVRNILLVAGCWLLVAGCWLLVAGCWLLVVTYLCRCGFLAHLSGCRRGAQTLKGPPLGGPGWSLILTPAL